MKLESKKISAIRKNGERYKLCYTCRKTNYNPKVETCCICMEKMNCNMIAKMKCNHGVCLSCMEKWSEKDRPNNGEICILTSRESLYVHCPICKREYLKQDTNTLLKCSQFYDFNNIICKCYFSDNIFFPIVEPMQIHTFCSKADLDFFNGKYYIDNEWKNRMIILVKLLIPLYEDKTCRSPLIFYVCDDKQGSIVLRSKKPFNEKDLIDASFFTKFIQQSPRMIDGFFVMLAG